MQMMVTCFLSPSLLLLPVHLGCVVLQNVPKANHAQIFLQEVHQGFSLLRLMAPKCPELHFFAIFSAKA